MKKLFITLIMLLLVLSLFSSCTDTKDNGDVSDTPSTQETTGNTDETTGSVDSETNTPETTPPETNVSEMIPLSDTELYKKATDALTQLDDETKAKIKTQFEQKYDDIMFTWADINDPDFAFLDGMRCYGVFGKCTVLFISYECLATQKTILADEVIFDYPSKFLMLGFCGDKLYELSEVYEMAYITRSQVYTVKDLHESVEAYINAVQNKFENEVANQLEVNKTIIQPDDETKIKVEKALSLERPTPTFNYWATYSESGLSDEKLVCLGDYEDCTIVVEQRGRKYSVYEIANFKINWKSNFEIYCYCNDNLYKLYDAVKLGYVKKERVAMVAKLVDMIQPSDSELIEKLAQEVMAGKWGVEPDRKTLLLEAGYDYYAVQDKVNATLFTSKYTVGGEYSQALDFKNYFGKVVPYFNQPYKSGDSLSNISLPGMAMTLYFWNRDYFDFVQVDMNNCDPMVIDGSKVRDLIRLAVKDYVNPYSYNQYKLRTSTNDAPIYYVCDRVTYSLNDDKYYFQRWGSDHPAGTTQHGYDKDSLQITETDTTVTAVAVIFKSPGGFGYDPSTARKLEYTFNKVVYNDLLYYQLVEVKSVE